MYDIFDWLDYRMYTTNGKVFTASTLHNDLGDTLDDALDRALRLSDVIEKIVVIPEQEIY